MDRVSETDQNTAANHKRHRDETRVSDHLNLLTVVKINETKKSNIDVIDNNSDNDRFNENDMETLAYLSSRLKDFQNIQSDDNVPNSIENESTEISQITETKMTRDKNGGGYEGEMYRGLPHGKGSFIDPDKREVIIGDLAYGCFVGKLTIINEICVRCGFFVRNTPSGNTLNKNTRNGNTLNENMLNGFGVYNSKAILYIGDFKNDKFHGLGALFMAHRAVFCKGNFSNGYMHGKIVVVEEKGFKTTCHYNKGALVADKRPSGKRKTAKLATANEALSEHEDELQDEKDIIICRVQYQDLKNRHRSLLSQQSFWLD